MARRHAARRAGAELAQPVGLDQGEHLRAVGGEEHDHEASALPESRVRLHAGEPKLQIGRGQDVQETLRKPQTDSRSVVHLSTCQAREASLHGLDGVLRREQGLDVRLPKVERHGRDTLGPWAAIAFLSETSTPRDVRS